MASFKSHPTLEAHSASHIHGTQDDSNSPRTPPNATLEAEQLTSPSFATAVLDPGSDPILAARHRSKSEAQLIRSTFYPGGRPIETHHRHAEIQLEAQRLPKSHRVSQQSLQHRSSKFGLPLLSNHSPTRPPLAGVDQGLISTKSAGLETRLRAASLSTSHHRRREQSREATSSPPYPHNARCESLKTSTFVAQALTERSDMLAVIPSPPGSPPDVDLRSAGTQYSADLVRTATACARRPSRSNTINGNNCPRNSGDSGRVTSDHRSDKSTDSLDPLPESDVDAPWLLYGRHARRDSGAFAAKVIYNPLASHESHQSISSPRDHDYTIMDGRPRGLLAKSDYTSRRSNTISLDTSKAPADCALDRDTFNSPKKPINEDDIYFLKEGREDSCHHSTTIEGRSSGLIEDLHFFSTHIDRPPTRRRAVTAGADLENLIGHSSLELVSSPELSAAPDRRDAFSPFPGNRTGRGGEDNFQPHNSFRQRSNPRDEQITLDEVDPRAVATALQYHRTSPSGATARDLKKISCELCGALVLRWAILLPCNHRACSACCCSGVNQVSTTPPRRHVCAACQVTVTGLTLSLPAAEAAQAAAWSIDGEAMSGRRQTAYVDPGQYPNAEQFSSVSPSTMGGELTGRFPGVAEALLGIDRPIRGKNDEVVAAAFARQPVVPVPSESETPQNTSSDRASNTADLSMTFSEDASFYGPQRLGHQEKVHTSNEPASRVSTASFSCVASEPTSQRNLNEEQSIGPPKYLTGGTAVRHPGPGPFTTPPGPLCPFIGGDGITAVVRVDNIPWKTSYQDIVKWIPDPHELLPDPADVAQPVHVPIDVKTGKTANCAFIELKDESSAKKLIRRRNNTKLCGRPVSLLLSSYEEVINELFPSVEHFPSGTPTRLLTYFTNWQLEQLTQLLKNGGPQLKSPLKPIEYTISLIQLVPDDLAPDQRDLLAEKALSVLKKGTQWLNSSVDGLFFALHRLIQASINNRTFTKAQKDRIMEHIRQIPNIRITTKPSLTSCPTFVEPFQSLLSDEPTFLGDPSRLSQSQEHQREECYGYRPSNEGGLVSAAPYPRYKEIETPLAPRPIFGHTTKTMDGATPLLMPVTTSYWGPGALTQHPHHDRLAGRIFVPSGSVTLSHSVIDSTHRIPWQQQQQTLQCQNLCSEIQDPVQYVEYVNVRCESEGS